MKSKKSIIKIVLGPAILLAMLLFFNLSFLVFTCAAEIRPYTSNPRYVTDGDGDPQFFIGLYEFLPLEQNGERYGWEDMLDHAVANNYNSVRALGIGSGWLGDPPEPPQSPHSVYYPFARSTYASDCPPAFGGTGTGAYDGGCKFDLSRLDDRFWNSLDAFLSAAEARGITVISDFFGVSGPFGSSGSNTNFNHNYFHSRNSRGGASWLNHDAARKDFFKRAGTMHNVQQRVLNKYLEITSRHNNVIHQPVNEMFGSYSGFNSESNGAVAADFMDWVKEEIRTGTYGNPNAVVLLNTEAVNVLSDYGIHRPDYDGITIHAPHLGNGGVPTPFTIDKIITETERLYSENRFIGFDDDVGEPYIAPDYKDYQRKAAWTVLTVGDGMYILLENLYLEDPWCCQQGQNPPCPPLPDADLYFRFIPRFLSERQIDPWNMTPARSLVRSGTATLLAKPGEKIVAYLRNGGQISLNLSGFPSNLIYEWYDPRQGSFPLQGTLTGIDSDTPIPTTGLDTTKDWVLHIYPDNAPPPPPPPPQQGIIFSDNFEDANASDWNPPGGQQSWTVAFDGSYVFQNSGSGPTEYRTTNGQTQWKNYSFKTKLRYKVNQGEIGVLFYHNNSNNYYEFRHRRVDNKVYLERNNPTSSLLINSAPGPNMGINEWWFCKVEVMTNASTTDIVIKLWREGENEPQQPGTGMFTYSDGSGRLQDGKVGLYSRNGVAHQFDDIIVSSGSGGTSCFLQGTLITMADGRTTKPIEQIKVSDKVLAFDDNQAVVGTVTATFEHLALHGYFIIKLKDGRTLKVTGEHPVFSQGVYRPVYEIKEGDSLHVLNNDSLEPVFVDSIIKSDEQVPVYNLEVDSAHNYFAEGCLVHNKIKAAVVYDGE